MDFINNLVDKFKDLFNIGGLALTVEVDRVYPTTATSMSGKLIFTTEKEKTVKEINMEFQQITTSGQGAERKKKYFDLGVLSLKDVFTIKPGETKEIPFTLNFKLAKTNAQELKEHGGVLGGIGKLGAFVDQEVNEYDFKVNVYMEGTPLPKVTHTPIQFN